MGEKATRRGTTTGFAILDFYPLDSNTLTRHTERNRGIESLNAKYLNREREALELWTFERKASTFEPLTINQ